MNWGFLAFLFSIATFILNLPELVDKLGKTVPFLITIDSFIDIAIKQSVRALPAPDPNLSFIGLFLFWPNVVVIVISVLLLCLFAVLARQLTGSESFSRIPQFLVLLAGIFICLVMSQVWLLHRSSSLSLWESLQVVSYPGKFAKADDKAYFLHGSNIYGLMIYVIGFVFYFLTVWLWRIYQAMKKRERQEA